MMDNKSVVKFYLSKYSPKEAKKRSTVGNDFFVVDISKIIRELGYDMENLSVESEFVINYTIRKKITQGIYSTKCDGILVCYKGMSDDFFENLETFLEEHSEDIEYYIQNL
jgi:hypothetical protein